MKRYKCLFVDWYLTLSTSKFWEQFSVPTHSHYPLFAFMESTLFGSAGMKTWLTPWMRGEFTSEEVIADVCRGTAYAPAFALQELRSSCQEMRLVSEAIPQLVAGLRAKGLRVVIATDNMDTFHRWTVPGLRLHTLFDDMLSSWQLRALKEDVGQDGRSLFFANYLQAQQLGPGESLLLDDSGEDCGNVIRQFGIDYQHIEPGKGLVPALQEISASLF